jgi:hypothetical protein
MSDADRDGSLPPRAAGTLKADKERSELMARTTKSTKAADEKEPVNAAESKNLGEPEPTPPTPNETAFEPIENEEFVITRSGRGIIEVKPVGWVGPPPLQFHESKLKAFKAAVAKL